MLYYVYIMDINDCPYCVYSSNDRMDAEDVKDDYLDQGVDAWIEEYDEDEYPD